MNNTDFSGRTVVVTGCSSGIGVVIARAFADVGARIVAHYRSNNEAAEALVAEIKAAGGSAIAVSANLDQEDQVEQLFAAALEQFGSINVLVNNAGSFPNATLLEMSLTEWRQMFADNAESTFLCSQAAARLMKSAGGGVIVNMSSISATSPGPEHLHYNSAKAAVSMFTQSAAQELGPHNIRVNAVAPGVVFREGIEENWPEGVKRFKDAAPLGSLVRPEDVASACVFLASDSATSISGAVLSIDCGVLAASVY